MSADINEHFPTDGSPRTFYGICRVKAEDKFNFIKAILPDVIEDTSNPMYGSIMRMDPYYDAASAPATLVKFARNPLLRFNPQRHPIHRRAYAVDAVVLRGNGFPAQSSSGELTFRTKQFVPLTDILTSVEGYVDIGVTWKDLPYEVEIIDSATPDANFANTIANSFADSEIVRYCVFRPQPKGQNAQIAGGKAYLIDDDGTILLSGGNPVLSPLESTVYYNPATTFSITLKMVPRVPYAAEALRGMCNDANNIRLPEEILKYKPDTGTLRFLGYEVSDPYYTCSGVKVFDITYSIGYRPGGNRTPNRGWNSTWCGSKRDVRRFVFGEYTGGVIKTIDGNTIALPVTNNSQVPPQEARRTTAQACIAPFADLQHLFRFEGVAVP